MCQDSFTQILILQGFHHSKATMVIFHKNKNRIRWGWKIYRVKYSHLLLYCSILTIHFTLHNRIIVCARRIKQSTCSVQSSKYLRKFQRTLHCVRIVWNFTLQDEHFLCFFNQPRRRGKCFVVPYTS